MKPSIKIMVCFFLITLCVIKQARSQNCAISEKKDPFTQQHIVETDEAKLYSSSILSSGLSSSYYISFSLQGDEFYICFDAQLEYVLSAGTSEFEKVTLLLSDNSIISLKSFKSPGGYKFLGLNFNKSYSMVDRLAIERIIDFPIIMVRFNTSSAPIDATIKANRANDISKLAKCILTYQSVNTPIPPDGWVNYKIDNKLSVKLPEQPQKVNESAVKASDNQKITYIVGMDDLAKTDGTDSTALASKATSPEYLNILKAKFTKSMGQGFSLSNIKAGTWKTYPCYYFEGTHVPTSANIYFFMVLIGSKLYQLMAFIPDGISSKTKDSYFDSLVLN
jgi:hypothetical protein